MFRKTQQGLGALFALGLTTLATPAHALPLLAETAGLKVSDILTVYPDSEDPNLVYFIPNSSKMARDSAGLPQFGLTYWGLGSGQPLDQAGAYLTFSLRLDSDESQRKALDSLIAEGKRVAVLPVQESTVGITSTKKDAATPLGRLFEEFNFAQRGGLYGDEVGVNAVLTGVGAKVFKAAIDNPQLLKAEYCSKVVGLGPDFRGKVTVDMKRVYTHFQTHASFGAWWLRVDISAEYEKLKKSGAIKIEAQGGDATDEEYLRKVGEDITKRIFTPELKMVPGQAQTSGWGFNRLSLNATHKEEEDHQTFEYIRRENVEREFCSNLAIKDLQPYKDQIVRNADAE